MFVTAKTGALHDMFDRHAGFLQQPGGARDATELYFIQYAASGGRFETAIQGAPGDAHFGGHGRHIHNAMAVIPDVFNGHLDGFVLEFVVPPRRITARIKHKMGKQPDGLARKIGRINGWFPMNDFQQIFKLRAELMDGFR
jgi:hypothetical protein